MRIKKKKKCDEKKRKREREVKGRKAVSRRGANAFFLALIRI